MKGMHPGRRRSGETRAGGPEVDMGALMRRKGGYVILALLVVLAVGCGRQERPSPSPAAVGYGPQEPPVTIDFWYMPNGPSPDKVIRREVGRFHELHPNITVRATKLDWPDALTRLTTAAASASGRASTARRNTFIDRPELTLYCGPMVAPHFGCLVAGAAVETRAL